MHDVVLAVERVPGAGLGSALEIHGAVQYSQSLLQCSNIPLSGEKSHCHCHHVVTARWIFPLSPTIPNTPNAQHSPPAPKMQVLHTASAALPAPRTRHQIQPNPASSAHPIRHCSRAGKLLEKTET